MSSLAPLLCCLALLQAAPPFDIPSTGQAAEQSLARGASHDWQMDLAAGEFLVITLEPLDMREDDEWPLVTVTSPDGSVVYETVAPTLAPGIDSWARTMATVITDRSGLYRLRVAARASPVRYRVRLDTRRLAIDDDRQRIEAHARWREGMRRFLQGTPDDLRAAIEQFTAALPLLEQIADDEGQAMTLGTIGHAWYRLSDAAQGRAAVGRTLEIWRRLGREREEGIALSDLGLLAYLGYDHPAARSYLDQALTRHRAAGDVHAEAITLTRTGWVHYAAAELQQVLDIEQQALTLFRQAGDHGGESIALNDLGRAYLDLGEVSQAIDAYDRALALRPPDRDARGAANVLIRRALVFLAVAEWQQALDGLRQARALAQRAHDVRTEASALINLGSAYMTFGDTAEAFRCLEPALLPARSIKFRNAEGYALLWMGVGASLRGELERSRDYLREAVAVQTAIKDVRGQATTLRQLAAVYLELGQAPDALQAINASIEVSPPASGLIYANSMTLANVYAALGDAPKAQLHYEEAIGRLREIRARQAEAFALTRFARFKAGQGLNGDARDLLEQALTIQESLRGLLVDPDLRMSYTSTNASLGPYQLYIDVLMALEQASPGAGFAATAFHTNERARARGLLDMLATSDVDIREGVDRTLVERERALRWNLNAKAAIQTRLLAGKRDERRLATLDGEIADLSRTWRETSAAIRQKSPAYASLTEPRPLTAAEVGKLLDARTVLLEYAPGEARSWLFVVTHNSFESFALPPRRVIDDAAREVHRLLTARQPVPDETAGERRTRIDRADGELDERTRVLSDLVLGPIASKLAGRLASDWRGRRLAIVAAGALEYVPFAALRVPGERTPLIARHEIVTLPSASSLALLRRDRTRLPEAQKIIAVLADPVFGADDPRVSKVTRTSRGPASTSLDVATRGGDPDTAPDAGPAASRERALATRALEPFVADAARGSLARLPFSRAEAIAVAAQVPQASLLQATDFDASLALATSNRLNGYRIVHFATHGLINTTRPELSGLALSLVDAQGRSRDGFLRLNTIYNLRLSADLVVLSACQTALGKEVASEGFVGLTRGFMYAGARRVIASLWQVSDVATAELMKKFYAGLLQRHLPAAAALRQAQLDMARDPRWSSPYFWAGFVLQGDWQQ